MSVIIKKLFFSSLCNAIAISLRSSDSFISLRTNMQQTLSELCMHLPFPKESIESHQKEYIKRSELGDSGIQFSVTHI